jgi:hypothetical protein
MNNSHPAPGWYPHPAGQAGRLYWDGTQWHPGIPATEPTSTASKFLWLAFAGFVVMKVPMLSDLEGTQVGALLTLVGFFVWVASLAGAATAALGARRRRRQSQTLRNAGIQPTAVATASSQG